MKYSFFERLVLAVGGGAILGSLLLSYRSQLVPEEIAAQLLLLGVLYSAVHWGRKGGFISALVASVAYIVMRIPLVLAQGGLSADVTSLVLVRVLSYGLVGIVGGELCGRLCYVIARLENSNSVDEWSQVYNQRFIARALEMAVGQFRRYQTPFCIVTLRIADTIFADLRATRQRSLVRATADHIRNDIRLVDEAGRLEDGTFLVVLPHTPLEGGRVVAERLRAGVCGVLGALDDSVTTRVMAAPEDAEELLALAATLAQSAADTDAT